MTNGPTQIPKSVVRAAEQLNEGKSVSKEEMMNRLTNLSNSDDEETEDEIGLKERLERLERVIFGDY